MKKSVSDGRAAALEVLLLLEKGAQVQAALDAYLRGASLKAQDRALCTELVYGFLRAEIRINYILQSLLRNPRKLPREMFLAMGLAVYALLFLERIPVHATVDWTVGHVRRRFGQAVSGVANGALRALVRQGDAPKQADYYLPPPALKLPPQSPGYSAALLQRDALFYGLPLWIVELWHKAYGPEDCAALMRRSLAAPYSCVRVNALSAQANVLREALLAPAPEPKLAAPATESSKAAPSLPPESRAQGTAVGAWGVAFAPGTSPRSLANAPLSYWQQQGDISFQSAGSQSAMDALHPQTWPQPVWDMCAGQGGKSGLLLELGVAVALSSDVHLQRLESFTGNIQRITSAFVSPLTGAFSQADLLLEAVARNCGQSPHCLPYIPPKNARKASNDPDDPHYSHNDDVYDEDTSPQPETSLSPVLQPPLSQNPDPSSNETSPGAALPRVALVDGCHAPANSWSGTILVDAPCSGLGVLSRRPDIRRRSPSLDELLQLQAQLLESAWQALQVGGALVYMTCTLNPAENEKQIASLQQKHPQAQLMCQWQSPHDHPWLEGMYAALCVKAPEAQSL